MFDIEADLLCIYILW